jgi:hypothetical protein
MSKMKVLRQSAPPALIAMLFLTLSVAAAPRIQLDPPVLELGRMAQNEVTEWDVLVHNLGDETLEIFELSTSCPCTFPEIIDERIEPGATGRIHVTFQSKTFQGDVRKVIEVYSNDIDKSYVEIDINVFVEAQIYVEPDDRKLDFGDVNYGSTPALFADFQSGEGEALEITILEHSETLFECKTLPGENGDDSSRRLSVSLKADASVGPIREIIRVGTNAPGATEIDLEIFGRVEAELMADPERLNFRVVAPGSSLSRELTLRSAGSVFSVTSAEVDLQGLEVEILDAGPGREIKLRVHGSALTIDDEAVTKSRGRLKGKIRIATDHPTQPELEVVLLYMLRV